MAKKIVGYINCRFLQARPTPARPIGPALGQRGLNIMEFCKAFNAQTQKMEPGLPLPVVITAYADKSFTFLIKTPPATMLIKKAAGIDKGSRTPHTDKVGRITRAQAEEIAKTKMPDLTAADIRCRHANHSRECAFHGHQRGGCEMSAMTKRQKAQVGLIELNKSYAVLEALSIVKKGATSKFDESVDVAVNLGIDAKKSDQSVSRLRRAARRYREETGSRFPRGKEAAARQPVPI